MKTRHFFAFAFAVALALPVLALAAPTPGVRSAAHDVIVNITDVYIPSGFDSGSDAFVVVNGLFPNTCYRWKEAVITHPGATEHEIRSTAVVNEGMCMMVLVPFTQEIQVGKLERGEHTLKFVNGDGTYMQKKLTIN